MDGNGWYRVFSGCGGGWSRVFKISDNDGDKHPPLAFSLSISMDIDTYSSFSFLSLFSTLDTMLSTDIQNRHTPK